MPANSKYLSSGWTRFSKIVAGILGAYVATMLVHIAIAKHVPDDTPVLLTAAYSAFLCWMGLMVLIYFIRKAWVSWLILVTVSLAASALIFLV